MYYDTQATPAGYVHHQRVGVLSELAANYTQRTGCPPVFVFSQEVALDPTSVLQTISLHMYNKGLTTGMKTHTVSLLELLSAGKTHQEMLDAILCIAQKNDGIVFLGDAYRYDYDQNRAVMLLNKLVQAYQTPIARCPLVLKAPPPSDLQLFRSCSELGRHCYHLSMEPMTFSTVSRPAAERPVRQPGAQDGHANTGTRPARQPQAQTREQRRSPYASGMPKRTAHWYTADPQLVLEEQNGLLQFATRKKLSLGMEGLNILPSSGRACLVLRLNFQELGQCKLLIVYDLAFSRSNRTLVSIAIGGFDVAQMRRRLQNVNNVFDTEVGGHLFMPSYHSRILSEYGSAAAILDGFIRGMM